MISPLGNLATDTLDPADNEGHLLGGTVLPFLDRFGQFRRGLRPGIDIEQADKGVWIQFFKNAFAFGFAPIGARPVANFGYLARNKP